MKSYLIISKNGGYRILEKQSLTVVAKAETRDEAIAKVAEIKAADRKEAEERKQRKAETKKTARAFEIEFTKDTNTVKRGFTKGGKEFKLEANNGLEMRSRYCYTLTIEGIGCVFTSGTIEAAVEYILNN